MVSKIRQALEKPAPPAPRPHRDTRPIDLSLALSLFFFSARASVSKTECSLFRSVGNGVKKIGLGHFEDTKSPVILAALGGLCVSTIGVLVPPSMFWSEFEMQSIAEPGRDLPHIWPQAGKKM